MTCFHPLVAARLRDGAVRVLGSLKNSHRHVFPLGSERLQLPCGQCKGCRMERSRQWAVRCLHEASLHEKNCFITLTYSDGNLPSDGSLDYRDFQLFMKKFRKHFEYRNIYGTDESGKRVLLNPIRFYMCGEYGEQLKRPHFHAIIFGVDLPDKKFYKRTFNQDMLYTSQILEDIWGKGWCPIGDVTYQSAAYVSRYIMKKVNGNNAFEHYNDICSDTGEIHESLKPEFTKMSLKPGIGSAWFDKFHTDVYPHDHVVVSSKGRVQAQKPPRYYDKKYEALDPDAFAELHSKRIERAEKNWVDNTSKRLAVREECLNAKLSLLKRDTF